MSRRSLTPKQVDDINNFLDCEISSLRENSRNSSRSGSAHMFANSSINRATRSNLPRQPIQGQGIYPGQIHNSGAGDFGGSISGIRTPVGGEEVLAQTQSPYQRQQQEYADNDSMDWVIKNTQEAKKILGKNPELKTIMDKLVKLETGIKKISKKKKDRSLSRQSQKSSRSGTSARKNNDFYEDPRGPHIGSDVGNFSRGSSRNRKDWLVSNGGTLANVEFPPHVQMKKELEEQQRRTLIEKDKIRELKLINMELKTKIKKLAVKTSGFGQLQKDYSELLANYQKSEAIRLDQEKQIKKLKKQVRLIEKPTSKTHK